MRIEILTLLRGVGWPMASVILHWCHPAPYPTLDYRAPWSLGLDAPPPSNFSLWWAYTLHCRELANEAGVPMRDLFIGWVVSIHPLRSRQPAWDRLV